MWMLRLVALSLTVGLLSLSVQAQTPAAPAYTGPEYVRSEAMIPVRDGVKLHTVILRPNGSEASGVALPFLMQRTPYGVDGATPESVTRGKAELAASGYIFVYQDIRGRYTSGGQFVMNRPVVPHSRKTDVDETTDTRDTIDWLLKNVPNNNGKLGVLGVSYPGFLAMMAGIDAHPAVKAISPQAPMTDIWLGDDFFHNGAFRETYGFDYVQQLEAQKTDVRVSSKEDQYDFFLNHVNFAGAAAAAGMTKLPTAQVFLEAPSYVKFWQDMAVERHLHAPEVPTLEVGGYWDQEDMWGTQAEYAALRPNEKPDDPLHKVFLVLGPWNHGGWSRGPGDELGGKFGTVSFGGQKTGEYYRTQIEAPFFEYYLKGRPGFDLKDTASFRTGENQWHRYDIWPPKSGFATVREYLEPEKTLSDKAPTGGYDEKAAAYVADPADPIPYRHRPVQSTYGEGSVWRTWLVEDQRFVSGRKDLANFLTKPMGDCTVTVTGDVTVDLFAATTGTDTDWIVKLIDVYPEDAPESARPADVSEGDGISNDRVPGGYELMVAEEIFRGRYRDSFTRPEPVKPGEVVEYKWSLHGIDHTFLKGHRMMVEVQSSWFPLYDRNPQTFVENIMKAPASAYKAETVSIYGSAKFPSHLDMPEQVEACRSAR
jgi:putative CocE/NonD family hydrolase